MGMPLLSDLKRSLTDNPTRELLVELLQAGDNINPMMKMVAYSGLMRLSDVEIVKISNMALHALNCLETGDLPGLQNYFDRLGVPSPISSIIISYAQNITYDE
jgi:hypothetical protein